MVSKGPEAWLSPLPFRPISVTCHSDFSQEEPRESLGWEKEGDWLLSLKEKEMAD